MPYDNIFGIAENSKLAYASFTSNAIGKLEIVDSNYIMSEIILKQTVKIKNKEDKEKAVRLLQKSEAACLISNSVKSRIVLEPNVIWQ